MEPSEVPFVGGHKLNGVRYPPALLAAMLSSPEEEQRGCLRLDKEEEQDIRHDRIKRTNTNRAVDDRRRNEVLFTSTLQSPTVGQDKVEPETSQPGAQREREGPLRRISALEAWKKGVVPPQKRGSTSQMATETS